MHACFNYFLPVSTLLMSQYWFDNSQTVRALPCLRLDPHIWFSTDFKLDALPIFPDLGLVHQFVWWVCVFPSSQTGDYSCVRQMSNHHAGAWCTRMITMIGRVIRDGDGFSQSCYCGYGPANPEDQVSQTQLKKERNLCCHLHIFGHL